MSVKSILVDARNADDLLPAIAAKIAEAPFIGLDIETQDSGAHEGIKAYRKKDTARVFDYRRTVITGFSVYADGDDTAYYVNLAHADVENRIPWEKARILLDAKKDGSYWIVHNGPFELTNFRQSLGYILKDVVCTLQMAVSTYGPDDYSERSFREANLGEMTKFVPAITKAFWDYEKGKDFNSDQGEIFGKICAKESKAGHSYNGWVKNLTYGYGLKKAVLSHFGVQMRTFEETLNGKAHMGELTGEETCAYGADDAYWAVRLFHHLLAMMVPQNNQLVQTFFEQENPMIYVFSDIACEGMQIDTEAVHKRRADERANFAATLRTLKAQIRALLPFEDAPNPNLFEKEAWYKKNWERYRSDIAKWANTPDVESDFDEAIRVRGAVPNAWYEEAGGNPKSLIGPNLSHYMPIRTILYDLIGAKLVYDKGKIQSDGECRGKIIERLKKSIVEDEAQIKELQEYLDAHPSGYDDAAAERSTLYHAGCAVHDARLGISVIESLNKLASIEQAMKLYLTPYSQLMDPDTGCMYPVVSSLLATRRMASSFPNAMQLAKQGETAYVRTFYEGDEEDHVLVSLDWSQVELVIIGEASGDPEFAKAYGQLPYEDLHKVAAATLLSAMSNTQITPEMFDSLRTLPDDLLEPFGFPLLDKTGTALSPKAAYKYNRGTAGGKGMNFGYWYSGALGSVANARGLSSDMMWKLTDAYRERFAVAEAWRLGLIDQVHSQGFVTLPDGHRRNRFEATLAWQATMGQRWRAFNTEGCRRFADVFTSKLARRAGNQAVNAFVQGTCATLAKRSIIGIRKKITELGLRARFKMPIHDEVLFSVHIDDVVEFLKMARAVMTHHPEIISKLKLHCTAAIGRNFGAFDAVKNPFGQVELDEAPKGLPCIDEAYVDKALPDDQVELVIDYMRKGRLSLAA